MVPVVPSTVIRPSTDLNDLALVRVFRTHTHLSLGKDAPEQRAVEPPEMGEVIELPVVGGLHHRYVRRAA